MDEEQAKKLKNKLHLLTWFIVRCEEKDPLEQDENEWHPDFEEAVSSILYVNEHMYIEEDDMHQLNNFYKKWSNRYQRLGFLDKDVAEFNIKEDELEKRVKEYHQSKKDE